MQIDGSWFLCDDTEAIRATIGDIIIFTADERNNAFGSLTVETVTANQEYRMTIHVDDDYLTDEKTVYPIRIDPTIEVNSSDGTRAIEDVTLNSTAVSAPASTSLYIGNRQNYGKTRILMKFPGLDLSSINSGTEVNSATVEIRDLMCESESMSISVHTFTGNTWSETDSDWSSPADWSKVSPNSYVTTAMDTKAVSYSNGAALTTPHRYAFNIKSAVQGWVSGDYNQNKGIIFKSNGIEGTTTYQKKTFASFNRSSYQPSVKVTYHPNFIVTMSETEKRTTVGSSFYAKYTAPSEVSWSSSDSTIATVDEDGLITLHTGGTVTITATSNENCSMKDSSIKSTLCDSCMNTIRTHLAAHHRIH